MAVAVIMPKQGNTVESCILSKWYVKPGDKVKPGDLLFNYETDKSTFDEECKDEGTVLKLFFEEGDEVEVLSPFDEVFNKTFKILNMKNMDGESIQKANVARMLFTCCCPLKLNEGDILRRKI